MTMRLFVVLAALMAAAVFNVALLVTETPPAAITPEIKLDKKDPLMGKIKWLPSRRVKNLKKFGLTDDLSDAVMKRLKRLDKEENRSPKWKAVLDEDQELGSRCFCNAGELPVRYKAAECILQAAGQTRPPAKLASLRKRIESQLWFDKSLAVEVFGALELQAERTDDATARGVAAMILGVEQDAIDRLGDYGGGLFGALDLKALVTKRPALEDSLVEYFAVLSIMAEAANDPNGSICRRKIITDTDDGEEESAEMR